MPEVSYDDKKYLRDFCGKLGITGASALGYMVELTKMHGYGTVKEILFAVQAEQIARKEKKQNSGSGWAYKRFKDLVNEHAEGVKRRIVREAKMDQDQQKYSDMAKGVATVDITPEWLREKIEKDAKAGMLSRWSDDLIQRSLANVDDFLSGLNAPATAVPDRNPIADGGF